MILSTARTTKNKEVDFALDSLQNVIETVTSNRFPWTFSLQLIASEKCTYLYVLVSTEFVCWNDKFDICKYQILLSIIETSKYISGRLDYSYMNVPEATLQRFSSKKVLWKYAENLQPTHAKVWFQ